MSAVDVEEVVEMAVKKTGVDKIAVKHRPRLLSDNGSCYISGELKEYLKSRKQACQGSAVSSDDTGQDRAISQVHEEHYKTDKLLFS